jgi:hypothetical protein
VSQVGIYCTVTDSVVVCVWLPPVAVMVTVLVPAGVEFDDPPLHPITAAPASPSSKSANTERLSKACDLVKLRKYRRARSKPKPPKRKMHSIGLRPFDHGVGRSFRSEADATLVAIVSFVVATVLPLGVTVAGLKEQVASAGSPEQAKVMADAKPEAGVAVMVVLPLPPPAIETEAGLRDRLKLGVPTTTLTAADLEAAKTASPPYCAVMLSVPTGSAVVV